MKCLLCNTDNTKPYLTIDKTVLVKCEKCELIYMSPQLTKEELRKLYSEDYMPYKQKATTGTPEENWLASHSGLHYKILRKIKRAVTPKKQAMETVDTETKKTVLDYGYGNGRYLMRMKREHPLWSLYGYDINDQPLEGVTTTSDMSQFGRIFDIINITHVLEHVQDPRETLMQLKSLLKEGGVITIEVPNIDTWKFRVFGKNYGNLCLPYHLFHFSPKTMTDLVNQSGLKVDSLWLDGSAKCTIRSVFNTFNIKKPVNPYLNLAGEKVTSIIGKKRLDTDVLKVTARAN